jgi:hypothetical protein
MSRNATLKGMIVAMAAGIGLSLGAIPAFADGKIGVAAAVKNEVQGRGSRAISVGSEVFANERIRTGDSSTAQFMFLDKTVMSMGPKAELVLDKYVYNPNRGSGQVVVNAVQGSMRFVTGSQNPTNYQIKTPVATLGIRGTVVDLKISAFETFIGVMEGSLTIYFNDGRPPLTIEKGWSVTLNSKGEVIGQGPYNGSDPNKIETADWIRIDEINQLNAINARNYVPPPPPVQAPPIYNYNFGPGQ